MKAPVYAPAVAYAPPALQPYALRVRNLPIAELMRDPAVWAVVVKHMPSITRVTGSGQLEAQLGNMTLIDLAVFGDPNNPAFALIDADLEHLPARVGRPQ